MNGKTAKMLRKYSNKIGASDTNKMRKVKKAWMMINWKQRTIERPKVKNVIRASKITE